MNTIFGYIIYVGIFAAALTLNNNAIAKIQTQDNLLTNQAIKDAASTDELKSVFNHMAEQLDYETLEDIDLYLVYINRFAELGNESAAKREYEQFLESLENTLGDESFAYLYVSMHSFSSSAPLKYSRHQSKMKKHWRDVERFGEKVQTKQGLIEFSLLARQAESAHIFFKKSRRVSSIAKMLRQKSDELFQQNSEEKLRLDLHTAKLFNKVERPKDALAVLEKVAINLEFSNLEKEFETQTRKLLIRYFDAYDMPEHADKQLMAIAATHSEYPLTDEPTLIVRIDPRYPVDAAKAGKEGTVMLAFDINEFGKVVNLEVTNVVGYHSFADEAQKAVSRWRYIPKVDNGERVISTGHETELSFSLEQ